MLRRRRPFRDHFCVLSAVLAATGCASKAEPPPTGAATSAIVGGQASGPGDDFAVYVQISALGELSCGGALVDPQIVLTNAECIVLAYFPDRGQMGFDCTLGSNVPAPSQITIGIGPTVGKMQTIDVKDVYVDTSGASCSQGIAALVLKTPVTGISMPPILLDSAPKIGAQVTGYGWGPTGMDGGVEAGTTYSNYAVNRQKGTGEVLLAGNAGTAHTPPPMSVPLSFTPGYLITSIQYCADFGDPTLDESGNLIGLNLDTANGSITQLNPCGDVVGIDTATWLNTQFIEHAYQAIGKMPHRAGSPPPADMGGPCSQDNQCNSDYCVTIAGRGVCSSPCKKNSDCPTSLECAPLEPDAGSHAAGAPAGAICLAPTSAPTPRGCSVSPPEESDPLFVLGVLSMIGLASFRRRRAP